MKSKIFFVINFCLLFGWKTNVYGMNNEIIKITSLSYEPDGIKYNFLNKKKEKEYVFLNYKNMQPILDYKNCCDETMNSTLQGFYFNIPPSINIPKSISDLNFYLNFNKFSTFINKLKQELNNYSSIHKDDNEVINNIIIYKLNIKSCNETIVNNNSFMQKASGLSLKYSIFLDEVEGWCVPNCSTYHYDGHLSLKFKKNKCFFELSYDNACKENLFFYPFLAQSIFEAKKNLKRFFLCINADSPKKAYCVKIVSVNDIALQVQENQESNVCDIIEITDISNEDLENKEYICFYNMKSKQNARQAYLVSEDKTKRIGNINETTEQQLAARLNMTLHGIVKVKVKDFFEDKEEWYYVRIPERNKIIEGRRLNPDATVKLLIEDMIIKKDDEYETATEKISEVMDEKVKQVSQLYITITSNIYNNGKILIFSLVGFTSLCAGIFLLYKNGVLDNIDFLKHVYNSLSMLQY